MVDNQTLDKIKDHFNIVEFVGRYVPLKKRGVNYLGNCPFHNEKTPSFTVSPAKEIFHCFGCGEGGNIFGFLMKIENIPFIEAVKKLAEEAGVEIEDDYRKANPQAVEKRDLLFDINQRSQGFFQSRLDDSTKKYLLDRGLSLETISKFGLGLAPDSWDGLKNFFTDAEQDNLLELGLLIKSEKGKVYDRFRKRVMFPIYNLSDKVIGFGGRALNSEDQAKYMNSPDSPLFNKGEQLYALNIAKKQAVRMGYLLLMEGYMDVISAHQYGFSVAVASLGTALTSAQARLMKRYSQKVIIAYDGDDAGQIATEKAIAVLYPLGFDIRVLQIPDSAKDPDEFLKTSGATEFQKLIENALPFGKFKLDRILNSYKIAIPEEKERALGECVAFLKNMSPIIQEDYAKYLSIKFNINNETIKSYLRTGNGYKLKKSNKYTSKPKSKYEEAEKIVLYAALFDAEARGKLKEIPAALISEKRKKIYKTLIAVPAADSVEVSELLASKDKELAGVVSELTFEASVDNNATKEAFDTIYSRMSSFDKEELRRKIREADANDDHETATELLKQYKQIINQS